MRVAPAIELSSEAQLELEKLSRRRTTPVRVVQRSRIILLAGKGMQNKEIAERLGIAPRMAALWRDRFRELGVAGLMKDAPRPGRTPRISAELAAQVVAKTTLSKPAGATHWSRSTMAREIGISDSSVGRIWRAHGLKPHRIGAFAGRAFAGRTGHLRDGAFAGRGICGTDEQPVGDRFDSTYNQRLTSHRRLRSACKLLTIRRRIFLSDTLRNNPHQGQTFRGRFVDRRSWHFHETPVHDLTGRIGSPSLQRVSVTDCPRNPLSGHAVLGVHCQRPDFLLQRSIPSVISGFCSS